MKKVKVYRVFGWILFGYGIIGYLANLLYKGMERGVDFSFSAIFGTLTTFALNFFLWGGLILLWRADRNEKPGEKSKWLKFIIAYGIFSLVFIGMLIMAIIIPNLVTR